MNFLDIVLLVILALFLWRGYRLGLLVMVGSFIVMLVALLLSSHVAALGMQVLPDFLGDRLQNWINTVIFGISVGVLYWLGMRLLKIADLLTDLPIVGEFKRYGGAFLGLLQGAVVVSALVIFLAEYPLWEGLQGTVNDSQVAAAILNVFFWIYPFLPPGWQEIMKLIRES